MRLRMSRGGPWFARGAARAPPNRSSWRLLRRPGRKVHMRGLVFVGPRDRIDDDHVGWRAVGLQLQAELFGDRREDRDLLIPFQLEVVTSLESRAIEDASLGVAGKA